MDNIVIAWDLTVPDSIVLSSLIKDIKHHNQNDATADEKDEGYASQEVASGNKEDAAGMPASAPQCYWVSQITGNRHAGTCNSD
jgi:hypothetical protein